MLTTVPPSARASASPAHPRACLPACPQYGTLGNWTAQLLGGGLATPCSPTVMAGAYDMGSWPSVALALPLAQGAAGPLVPVLAAAHVGISTATTDPDDCGIAVARPGVLLDGWPLAELFEY
jgi:hypothetical protein